MWLDRLDGGAAGRYTLGQAINDYTHRIKAEKGETKAWSVNFRHSNVLTTLLNYGDISTERQAEIVLKSINVEFGSLDLSQISDKDFAEETLRRLGG